MLSELLDPLLDRIVELNIDTLKKLAEAKDVESQKLLGQCYASGRGVQSIDYAQAAHWYQEAENQEDKEAQHLLGVCYWIGRSVRKDDVKVLGLFEASEKKDYVLAELQLG